LNLSFRLALNLVYLIVSLAAAFCVALDSLSFSAHEMNMRSRVALSWWVL
jgi:hypothetical protein